jgi:hypothetical protein
MMCLARLSLFMQVQKRTGPQINQLAHYIVRLLVKIHYVTFKLKRPEGGKEYRKNQAWRAVRAYYGKLPAATSTSFNPLPPPF